jgi:hypothetical protein
MIRGPFKKSQPADPRPAPEQQPSGPDGCVEPAQPGQASDLPAAPDVTGEAATQQHAEAADGQPAVPTAIPHAPILTPSGVALPPAQATALHDSIDMEKSTLGEASTRLLGLFQYSASLPERTLRSAGALAGGFVRESANWLLPSAFRNSRSYSIFIQQMLDFVVNDLGGVRRRPAVAAQDEAALTPEEKQAQEQAFLARKSVGSLLDMSALVTLHLSPLTVLAIFSDVAYGSNQYMRQLSERLKEQQIIDEHTTIDSAADLLSALENASAQAADVFDRPPISIEGLRNTIQQTREAISKVDPTKLLPAAEIDQLWRQINVAAKEQNASIWDVSATMSLVALGRIQSVGKGTLLGLELAGDMFNEHIIQHYWEGLRAIEREGLIPTLSTASAPYLEAVWTNFAVDRKTWTEQLLSGELIKWGWSQISWPKLLRPQSGV